ncbi:transmembrane protein 243 isoform X2 [Pseudorasbora parva]|uniref:transmembrane protein 243 isoform X2 n=1 Tax=Pseudorasbora parva TaxID=51549 RepID=UPI00351EEE94
MTRNLLSPTRNMEDFRTRTLLGETLTLVTVISSFVFPTPPPTTLNIFFVVCIIMICSSVLVLIFWYRQGDLDPKFRGLIYYSIGLIILLCLCANLYFHDVGR